MQKANYHLDKHCEKLWRSAKDFSDLLILNQKFLLSEILKTLYHCGLIEDEIISLVNDLLKLHEFRLIIDDS